MSISIREGFSVQEDDAINVEALRRLENLGIFKLKREKVQYCKCNAPHIVNGTLLKEGKITCSCGRTVHLSKAPSAEYFIGKLDYDKIVEIISTKLLLSGGTFTYDPTQRCWIGIYKEKKIPIFILEISSFNQYIDEQVNSCWICILLDWEKEKGKTNYYNVHHFVKAEELFTDKIKFKEILDQETNKFDSNKIIELGDKFDKYVKSITWSDFEQFSVDFLEAVKANYQMLEKYVTFLSLRKNTIINSKIVKLGGPGNPDFVEISLDRYLQDALSGDKFGEVKHYIDYELTVQKYGTSIFHAHTTDSATLCIVASNKIDPEIWMQVITLGKLKGRYKEAILERDTLVLLIKILGLEKLIEPKKIT